MDDRGRVAIVHLDSRRKNDDKFSACADLALCFDCTVVIVDDCFDDGKTQS